MTRRVPFLDLRVLDPAERTELITAVETVLQHGRIVLGPEVTALEEQVAARCGRRYGVAVNSGTDALFVGLKALGLGPGDEVITTALSWIATTNAIAVTGATPVFADIRDDLNIDPASVEKLITKRTKAILPVHYTGKMCEMPALMDIAAAHGVAIVEDASQAFDAAYGGRKAGSFGEIGCFSMNPMKVFAACGEAGMVVTDRQDIYDRLVSLRYNGTVNREQCVVVSLNARVDTLQAAMLLRRLPRVDAIIAKRRQNASRYDALLAGVVDIPKEGPQEYDVYYTYQIRARRRDALKSYLEARGIETKIQHPFLMPQQPVYQPTARGAWSNAERLLTEILCLPIQEKLAVDDIDYVAACVRAFYEGASM